MNRPFTLALLLCLPAFAADQIVLTNGDTLTGTIVRKDGAKLDIKSELLGEVEIPWKAIKSIDSNSEVFVQLPSGEVIKGKLAIAGNQLEVETASGTRTLPVAQVTAVRDAAGQHAYERLEHPRLLEVWAGNFDIGLSLARGNARTDTLTTAFTAARNTHADKVAVYFNQIYGTARANNLTSTIASAVRGGWSYNRNVTPRFFVSAMNSYEHDGFQNLDLRFVAGLGAGLKAIRREAVTLDLEAGGDYARENFLDGVHRNVAEANFGDTFAYKLSRATSITQGFQFFNNLSEAGQYRMNFDLTGVMVMRKWLAWHTTASDRYLSNPVEGRQRNDLLVSTGFRISFAR